jgi:hypothetical protein
MTERDVERILPRKHSGELAIRKLDNRFGAVGVAKPALASRANGRHDDRRFAPRVSPVCLWRVYARTATAWMGAYGRIDYLPGRMDETSSLAVFLRTPPSSGSSGIIVIKCTASLSVMCGGSGGTFESV